MYDGKRRARKVLVAVTLLGSALNVYGQTAGCNILNVYDADAFSTGRKLGLAVFEVGTSTVGSNAGPLEKPREILLERFEKDLKKTKYFSAVSVVALDEESDADYLLEGNLIGLNGGSRRGRSFFGGFGDAGQMRVAGRILGAGRGDKRPVLSDWECNVFQSGGEIGGFGFGLAGLAATAIQRSTQSNAKLAQKNAQLVSDSLTLNLARLLKGKEGKTRLDKLVAQVDADADRSPITGKSQATNRKWREKAEWDPKDYLSEIDSFIVRSKKPSAKGEGFRARKSKERIDARSKGVDVLWLTSASYTAHAKVLPSLKQGAILTAKDLKRGMLTDLDPVSSFLNQDAIVLVATFDVPVAAAPFLWDTKRISTATYLTRTGSENKLPPSQFLDEKIASYVVFDGKSDFRAFHPVVLAFPAKRPDGTPFFQSIDDVAELHTEVDGRPVQITFNLKHFDLKSVEELKMGGSTQKGN